MEDDKQPHPLEDLLNIKAGSTEEAIDALKPEIPQTSKNLVDPSTGELVPRKVGDVTESDLDKEERIDDLAIDSKLESIHTAALDAFESQHRLSQEVDPKFSARNAEVAAQYLNIALNSVNSKIDAKYKRSKIRLVKDKKPNQVQNNVIVADRNSLLKTLFDNQEVEMKEIKGEPVTSTS